MTKLPTWAATTWESLSPRMPGAVIDYASGCDMRIVWRGTAVRLIPRCLGFRARLATPDEAVPEVECWAPTAVAALVGAYGAAAAVAREAADLAHGRAAHRMTCADLLRRA